MEIVMPLSMNFLCYNTVDKAMLCQKCQKYQISVQMSKNIEPGIINYVSLY